MAQYSLLRPRAADPWGDLGQLRREMDALFHRFGGGPSLSAGRAGVFPAVNFYETTEAYILTAELPGVETGDIDISLEGSIVTLRGERKFDYIDAPGTNLHRIERQSGSFRRAFELPTEVEVDKVEAVHKNGVLMLHMPKTPEAKPRQIAVKMS